jgi:predicted acylesterase/phospholipase RssA
MVFSALVLSGGGMKGLVMLGALYFFELAKTLNWRCIQTYVGTSVGGILCVLLAAGYLPSELINMVMADIIDIQKILTIGPKYTIPKINDLLTQKLNKDMSNISMKDFANVTKKSLRLIATCLNSNGHVFVMDKDSDISLLMAIEATTSIPILFSPVTYKNHVLVDGALSCNFPLQMLDMDTHNTLAISFSTKQSSSDACISGPNIFLSFVQTMLANFATTNDDVIKNLSKTHGKLAYLSLDSDVNSLNMTLNKTQMYNAIKSGYFQASAWDSQRTTSIGSIRRRSCTF